MPDISMCSNTECPLAEDCYRNALSGTKPSSYQSMCYFEPEDGGLCDMFMKVWK